MIEEIKKDLNIIRHLLNNSSSLENDGNYINGDEQMKKLDRFQLFMSKICVKCRTALCVRKNKNLMITLFMP